MNRSAILGLALLAGTLAGCEIGTEPMPAESLSSVETSQDVPQAAPDGANAPMAPVVKHRVARGRLRFVDGFAHGYAQAVREQRPMLVFFTAEWCRFCHEMADEAFTNQQVVDLSRRFVCILVDGDLEADVCRQFGVRSFPTLQFLSPTGVPLNRVVGKQVGHQVMMAMQAALQNVARRSETGDKKLQ